MNVLVVGRGLLGRNLVERWPVEQRHTGGAIAWSQPDVARRQLADLAVSFASGLDGSWRVAWCAGAGVVGSPVDHFAVEQSYLQTFLDTLGSSLAPQLATDGMFFLASSAGGVFGSGSAEVITEASPESPVSAYGHAKLDQEKIAADWAAQSSVPTLIGRLSNLYGPGQNLAKPQGFVSQLLRSILLKQPFRLRALDDTQRDFLSIDDAAARIHALMERELPEPVTTKLIVSGRSHTLTRVTNTVRAVTRVQPKVVYAATTSASQQPRSLRFASRVMTDVDAALPCRGLEVGIAQTWQAMLSAFERGQFS